MRSCQIDGTVYGRGCNNIIPAPLGPTQILPLENQVLAKGYLLFSLFPWNDFDYAGELDKSNSKRGLQVR